MFVKILRKGVNVVSAFVFKDVLLVDLNSMNKNGNLLIFVTVMDRVTYLQANLLYFGDFSFDDLLKLKGSVVDCVLKPSAKGFTVCDFIPKSGAKSS